MSRASHGTSWEDARMANVVSCGDVRLAEDQYFMVTAEADDEAAACPNCGKLLRLVWDVRVVEEYNPTDAEATPPATDSLEYGASFPDDDHEAALLLIDLFSGTGHYAASGNLELAARLHAAAEKIIEGAHDALERMD